MITASIVTYNEPVSELLIALEHLNRAAVDKIYVVDNGRNSQFAAVCLPFTKVEYIPSDNNGYGSGHNKAIEKAMNAGSNYHLVMNSDIIFKPEDIAAIAAYMDANPDVGALHPRIFGLDGNDQYTVRMLPTPFDLILRRFLPSWLFPRSRDRYLLKHLDRSKIHSINYMQGSFMFLRTEVLRKTGLFDTRFFMYPEDIDLTRRISEVSKAIYYPAMEVVHAHRAASYTSPRMLRIHIVNIVRYFNKWGWLRDPFRKQANSRLKA